VLLECTFDAIYLTGDPKLILTVTDSFSLKDGDVPLDYIMPGSGTVRLSD